MKFTTNTKPVVSGLDLGIIASNITKFYQKSCIVELTIEENLLRINTEVSSIKSELKYKGKVEGEGSNHIFVDSLLFKNLMKTLDSDLVEFEISNDVLTVYSGQSKFNLPQIVSGDDLELARPSILDQSLQSLDINKQSWEFIKDQQMYAISMSFAYPVYTNVWLGKNGDVIVGDFDNSIFTHSTQSALSSTCLITDTIVNLLTAVPEDAKITQIGKNYLLKVDTDPYSYICEFSPKYEDDEGVGNYSSDIILSLFQKPEHPIELKVSQISKYISQAELFSTSSDDTLDLEVSGNVFSLSNQNINCKIPLKQEFESFKAAFKISFLKDVISHMDNDDICICPLIQDDVVAGLIVWTDTMEAMLAGVE